MADNNLEMRLAYLCSERGAVMLPSATDAGNYVLARVVDGVVINTDATLDDVKAFVAAVDPTI
jgi:hypothetical protein